MPSSHKSSSSGSTAVSGPTFLPSQSFDSADPKRNPPPLPLNPTSPRSTSPRKERDTFNSSPIRASTNTIMPKHQRVNSEKVKEMSSVFGGGTSPTKNHNILKEFHAPSKELFPEKHTHSPSSNTTKENNPGLNSLRTLKSFENSTSAPSHASHASQMQELEMIGQQLSNLTQIAAQLQKEMASLSRRSKDNASDLISLKEATKSRDEDIRKSLKELVSGLGALDGVSGLGIPTFDKEFSPRKSTGAGRVPGVGVGLGPEMQILERILRDMSTKDGEDRLLNNLHELKRVVTKELPTKAGEVKIMGLIEEVKDDLSTMAEDVNRFMTVVSSTLEAGRMQSPHRPAEPPMTDHLAITRELRRMEATVEDGKTTTEVVKGMLEALRTDMANYGRSTNNKIENLMNEVLQVGRISMSRAATPAVHSEHGSSHVDTEVTLNAIHAVTTQTLKANNRIDELQGFVEDFRAEVKHANNASSESLVELSRYLDEMNDAREIHREDAKEIRKVLEVVRTGVQGMNDRFAHFEGKLNQKLTDAFHASGRAAADQDWREVASQIDEIQSAIAALVPQIARQLTETYERHLATVELKTPRHEEFSSSIEKFHLAQLSEMDKVIARLREETLDGLRGVRDICNSSVNASEQIVQGIDGLKKALVIRIETLIGNLRDDTLEGLSKVQTSSGAGHPPVTDAAIERLREAMLLRIDATEKSIKDETIAALKGALSGVRDQTMTHIDAVASNLKTETAQKIDGAVVDLKAATVTELITHTDGVKGEIVSHIDSTIKSSGEAIAKTVGTKIKEQLGPTIDTSLSKFSGKLLEQSKASSGELLEQVKGVNGSSKTEILTATTKNTAELKEHVSKAVAGITGPLKDAVTVKTTEALGKSKEDLTATITSSEQKIRADITDVKKTVAGGLAEHKNTQKVVADVLAAVEGLGGEWKGNQPKLFNALSELKHLLQEAEKAAKKKEAEKKKATETVAPPPSEKYDDTEVKERLDRLIAHTTLEAKHFPQLELLDTIHKQVMSTSSDISEFIALQTEYMRDITAEKQEAAHKAEIAAEKARTEEALLKQSADRYKEDIEKLTATRDSLLQETNELNARKMKLAAEVTGIEVALSLRREELINLESRAEALEKRALQGVIDQSRAILMTKASSKAAFAAAGLRRPVTSIQIPEAQIPKQLSGANTSTPRRHLSLSGVNSNVAAARDGTASGRVSVAGSNLAPADLKNLKRSHSVKNNQEGSVRKSSWGEKLGTAFVDDKENAEETAISAEEGAVELAVPPERTPTPLDDVSELDGEEAEMIETPSPDGMEVSDEVAIPDLPALGSISDFEDDNATDREPTPEPVPLSDEEDDAPSERSLTIRKTRRGSKASNRDSTGTVVVRRVDSEGSGITGRSTSGSLIEREEAMENEEQDESKALVLAEGDDDSDAVD